MRIHLCVCKWLVAFLPFLAMTAHSANLLANGDFDQGDLTGWSLTLTANGSAGVPEIVPFETVFEKESRALRVQVGQLNYFFNRDAGVAIGQFFEAAKDGLYQFSADFAALGISGANGDPGRFRLLVDDGEISNFQFFPNIYGGEIVRSSFMETRWLEAGKHFFQILVTRTYLATEEIAPYQYIDNVSIVNVFEPSVSLLGAAGLASIVMVLAGCGNTQRAQPGSRREGSFSTVANRL